MAQGILRTSLVTVALLLSAYQAAGAQSRCPHRDGDACDQWYFEEADRELTAVLTAALARIDEFAHPDTRQEAKDKLAEAHRSWISLRALDCQSESAFVWLRSARTRAGYTATCMHALTIQRTQMLKRRYLLTD